MILAHEKRIRANEQFFAEVMLDFALEEHELVALVRGRIQRNSGEHRKIRQAHVRRDVAREATYHSIVAEMVVEPRRAREIVGVVVDNPEAFGREV